MTSPPEVRYNIKYRKTAIQRIAAVSAVGIIIACYTASSTNKKRISRCPFCGAAMSKQEIPEEYKDRVGVHCLTIISKDYIKGTFADQYPSASYGEIFFFRKKEDRDEHIKRFLCGSDANGAR